MRLIIIINTFLSNSKHKLVGNLNRGSQEMKENNNKRQQECYKAIENAYTSLKEKKLPKNWAIDVGARIYKFHYPESIKEIALENANVLFAKQYDRNMNKVH